MLNAAELLRERAKEYELQAAAHRERETSADEVAASDNLAIAVALNEVANALEQEAA